MRKSAAIVTVVALLFTVGGAAQAALISKTFKYRHGVLLEIGASSEDGLRLDSVQFFLPSDSKGPFRFGPGVRADVAVSNLGPEAQKVGIAIALFDARGRLVGVASGGSALLAIKPQRQSFYSLTFKDVNNLAAEAVSFQISVERK